MDNSTINSQSALKLAIDAAGLGRFEYNHTTKQIVINDRVRSWLKIQVFEPIQLNEFVKSIKNYSQFVDSVNNAFENGTSAFLLEFESNCSPSKAFQLNGQIVIENQTITGIIQPTENKKESLAENYFQITNAVPAIVWITDADGYCTYLNQQWGTFTGLPIDISEGFGWLNAIHPDDRKNAENIFIECNTNRKDYKVDIRIQTMSGDYRWCIDRGIPKFSSDGTYEGMVGTVIDVHDEKLAGERSRYREEELNSIVESATFPIGVYIGKELRIKIANKSMIKAWGKGDDVIGKLYTEILPELSDQEIFSELQYVFSSGKPIHHENKKVDILINQTLTTHYFNYSFTPVFDSNGNVYGVMNTAADVTDLNLAKSKSQQNELRFEKLVETAPAAIGVFVGRDLLIETHNKTFALIVGKGNDIAGKPLRDVMPELLSEGQPFLKILDDVYTTGIPFETFGTQVKIVQNGIMSFNYYDFTYTPMFDENGEVYAILDIAIDVTSNVIAQNKVLESEKSLRNTILKAPVAMCILKQPNFIVEIANDRMLELWKVESSIIGNPIFDFVPEAQEQGFDTLLLRVINNGETITASETLFTTLRDGDLTNVYVDFVYEPFKDNDETITGIIVVAHDVTQQVLSRRKIEDAEERARLAIDAADLGVYELNLENDEIISSDRFDEIMGVPKNQNRSETSKMIHDDDKEIRENALRKALSTGNLDYEARIKRHDNSQVWFRAKGKIIMDDAGKPKTLIGVVQDISEQKQFAEELTRLVFRRTMELQRSNEDLQQFAHVASHDLKEPVRKIKFYSNMLQDQFSSLLPPKALGHLNKIHNATDRMFSMIDGVLKYSSIRGSAKDIEKIDLNTIFADVESDLEVLINQKGADIVREKLPEIEGAAVLIHQLFYNLINNALKFSTTDEQPLIAVTAELLTKFDIEMVKITIADNGIGIDSDYITKIFNPFIRLNPKDKYEGTGLGLSLCKKIIEQHFGIIEATGSSGEGAIFTIILPLKQHNEHFHPTV